MSFVTSAILKRFLEQDRRKFEGLFPDLIKRLILSSCQSVSNIRMPGLDDVWAPGFDGIVESKDQTPYFTSGKSVWEFGINADSLSKINDDYQKRTNDPLGIDKSTTTFYLVVPRIWAYKGTSISQWESEHKVDWLDVHVYDASALCDWINSEPAVCAWLFEQYGEGKHLNFSTVTGAWVSFSNRTKPPLSSSMFLEARQNEALGFQDKLNQKMCRIKADTFLDAYGFCLSVLMQNAETANRVIVINNEDTYLELARYHTGKVFLLSFPFYGQVSDDNSTVLCFSKESPSATDMIKLPALWKSQFTRALCDMGLSEVQASECYSFTHGNLLSLIRRIPGNAADSRPKWADDQDVVTLCPIIFLRQFSTASDIEKHVLEMISGIAYSDLERKYEAFLRMEDAPVKRLDGRYFLVNYEEAWMTLRVDASDVMSVKMHETIIALLSDCRELDEYQSQPQASIIKRLIYNYIYFAETGSDKAIINSRVKAILSFAQYQGCKEIIFKSLSDLAEAAPAETLSFIESELDHGVVYQAFNNVDGWANSYQNVLWALDKLVLNDDTAIRACKVLYKLCKIKREYSTSNSPKDSLLTALCLWSNHTAITIGDKTRLALWFIGDDSSFGVPFAIDLITKDSVLIGNRFGKKAPEHETVTGPELYSAYSDIASALLNTAIKDNRADWVERALKVYWYIPPEVLTASSEFLASANFSPAQKLPVIFEIRRHLYYIQRGNHDHHKQWIGPLNKWLDCLITDDPVSKEGWRFYKTYGAPFSELLSESEDNYQKIEQRTQIIREQAFSRMRDEYGTDAVVQLSGCMEDSRFWGDFLGKNLLNSEYLVVASTLRSDKKKQLLAGLVSSVDFQYAAQLYNMLSQEEQKALLPLLYRGDIDGWLSSPELEQLYWQNKQLFKPDDRAFPFLMKYNPCGILRLFFHKENEPDTFQRLIEVFHAIVESNNYSDPGLLSCIIQEYDKLYYSEEWAALCLQLYDNSGIKDSFGYYPTCLRTYFFNHPEIIVERYHADSRAFYRHFHYHYTLPDEAYENPDAFVAWSDYLYNAATEEPFFFSTLGSIMGRSGLGGDGIFPQENVRIALERYSNDDLTREVAVGWLNSRGARIVQDGVNEKKMESQYRGYARNLELEYPQTAKVLSIIADDYRWEAKIDQVDSELFPQ